VNAYFASAGPSVPTESDINIPVGADNTIQLPVWTGDHMTGHMTRKMTVHKVVNKSKADTLPCSVPSCFNYLEEDGIQIRWYLLVIQIVEDINCDFILKESVK